MSIIDDTFKRLGDGHAAHGAATPLRSAASGQTADLDYVVGSSRRSPVALVLLSLIFAGAGVLVYVLLPEANSPSVPAVSLTESPVSPPVAVTTPVAVIAAPQVAPLPVAVVAGQAVMADVSPVQAIAVDTEPQGVIAPPSWYEDGWRAASQGEWPKAFSAWEEGVNGLPRDRMMITGNSYAELRVFSNALKQYAAMFPAIGIRQQHYNGQMVYRLVVFPYGGGTRQILPKVQSVFARAGLVNASYIRARMLGAAGVSPALENAAKAGGEATTRAARVEAAPVRKPAAVDKAQLFTASRMPADNPDVGVSGAAVRADNTNAWESRAQEIRNKLKAEAYADVANSAQVLSRDFPDRWEAWFWLGTARLALGQMEEAASALKRAGKLNPKVSQIWVQRAVVAQELGDHAAAVRLLIEARDLSPKSPQIYLNLGYSNDALGLSLEAEKNYRYFMALTDGDVAYLLQRTLVVERLERKHQEAD